MGKRIDALVKGVIGLNSELIKTKDDNDTIYTLNNCFRHLECQYNTELLSRELEYLDSVLETYEYDDLVLPELLDRYLKLSEDNQAIFRRAFKGRFAMSFEEFLQYCETRWVNHKNSQDKEI